LGHRRGGEECREMKRAKIKGWTWVSEDWRGEKTSFGEKDREEFDQVKVALVLVFVLRVPDEFGVSGHVVVGDHAAVRTTGYRTSSGRVVRRDGEGEEKG
jgi:hypothetical protein